MSHSKPHTDPMDQHDLGKHQHAPKAVRFKNAGAVHTAGNGISVDLDELTDALGGLNSRVGMFENTVQNVSHLDSELPNGAGPIAESMAALFQHRLGEGGGVQYALQAHLTSVKALVQNLTGNVEGYQAREAEAVALLQGLPGAQTS